MEREDAPEAPGRQRLDRWLWHARLVRTRAAAADLVKAGHVRVDGTRVTTVAHGVKPGQVLTVALPGGVKVVRVRGFSERRGDATSVVELLDDLTDDASG